MILELNHKSTSLISEQNDDTLVTFTIMLGDFEKVDNIVKNDNTIRNLSWKLSDLSARE